MYKSRREMLSGKESYSSAHRSREFHLQLRAFLHFVHRRAFVSAMKAVREGGGPKVVEFAKKPLSPGQKKMIDSIRRNVEQRKAASQPNA